MHTEETEAAKVGTCCDCKKTIYADEPFERVGVDPIDNRYGHGVGVFRCAECALKAKGLNVTTQTKKSFITPEQEALALEV